jgi:hypothetical protein
VHRNILGRGARRNLEVGGKRSDADASKRCFVVTATGTRCKAGCRQSTIALVIVELPSRVAAEDWYKSAEYRKIISLRLKSSAGNLIIVDGFADQ